MPFLTQPSETYKASFIQAVREFHAEGRYTYYELAWLEQHFTEYLQELQDRLEQPRDNRVPETVLWLVDGQDFIGRTSIRHQLTPDLAQIGGNIGYEIRPNKRRRGYGKLILALALEKARLLGLNRVLVTCDDDNIGSAKIIEANGGHLQDTIELEGHRAQVRRYWIDL
jgi:predicted acetyltransferase